ncbi:MAG: hypothetical protein GXZ06_05925 [Tissierellia bacterium]|nr:hypothetical protein [Tissierellia bacterium]
MKKILFLLSLVLLMTSIPTASYGQNYDKQLEEAILKSKKLFGITDEYDKFDYSVSTYNDEIVFYLNWHDSKEALGYITVTITADGTVTSYNKWYTTSQRDRTKLPNMSKEEGLTIANKFIEKVSPEYKDRVQYVERNQPYYVYSEGYNYLFVRVENEIPYYGNSIEVFVDNHTAEVTRYYVNWDKDLNFTDKSDLISLDQAKDIYKNKIGLDLIYKQKYDTDKLEYYLVYSSLNTNLSIDAKNGDIVSDYYYYRIAEDVVGESLAAGGGGLSPQEAAAVEDIKGIITKEEAEKAARDLLDISDDYKLGYVSLYRDVYVRDNYYWSMDFTKDDDYSRGGIYVSINAKNKELISLYSYDPITEDTEPKYDKEKALDIAEEFIDKVAKNKKEFVVLNENPSVVRPLEKEKYYTFHFIRKFDKAYVQNNGIYITVNAINGKVTDYNLSWYEVDFPLQDQVMSLDKAYDILFEEIGMELKYVVPHKADMDGRNKENEEAILVYGIKTNKPLNIDANSGLILDYNGKPYKEYEVPTYIDIDLSYAKDKIIALAQLGIALPGEEFRPEEKMIQRDFLYLLAKADYAYIDLEDEEKLYGYLTSRGIIKEEEKAPEKFVTKEEAIKYIIRALNYEEIAELTDIFKDIFEDSKDISEELKGYVAIAYGLKIVEGDKGKLYPKTEIKREDGAVLIYNYLLNSK